MDYRAYTEMYYNSIYHYGVKGQKWGVRRYQNEDGSLTPEGKAKYGKLVSKMKQQGKSNSEISNEIKRREKLKKAVGVGAAIAGTAVTGYALYKGGRYLKKRRVAKQLSEAANEGYSKINPEKFRGKDEWDSYRKYELALEIQKRANKEKIANIETSAGKSIVSELLKDKSMSLDQWRQIRYDNNPSAIRKDYRGAHVVGSIANTVKQTRKRPSTVNRMHYVSDDRGGHLESLKRIVRPNSRNQYHSTHYVSDDRGGHLEPLKQAVRSSNLVNKNASTDLFSRYKKPGYEYDERTGLFRKILKRRS